MTGTAALGRTAFQSGVMTMSLSQSTKFAYSWSEDGTDITITIPLDSKELPSKGSIDVEITATAIRAGIKGATPLLQGALYATVGLEGAVWQLERAAKTITIHLEKDSPEPWPLLVVDTGDGKIDAQSLFFYAFVMDMGSGVPAVPSDPVKALAGLRLAAEQGNVHAMLRLGELHTPDEGSFAGGSIAASSSPSTGVQEDAMMALDLYLRAATLGDSWGATKLGMALGDPATLGGRDRWGQDMVQAKVWLTQGASAGVPLACYLLGLLEENLSASGGEGSIAAAADWYRKAGDLPVAMHKIAWLTAQGVGGVQRDTSKAKQLFTKACSLDPSMYMPTDDELKSAGTKRVVAGKTKWAPPFGTTVAVVAVAAICWFAYTKSKR
mmetsp:Transcript_9940/g.24314  ORF Transcript_9940/g.24314 Transcript_9940/m.24314 type:complete len:382 (-) Transcript_9940:295-1440(-)